MIIALGRHLADSTIFALVIWLACFCMKRRGPATRYTLWLMAVAKFVVPTAVFLRVGESLRGLLPRGQVLTIVPVGLSQWVIPPTGYESSKAVAVSWSDLLIAIWAAGAAVAFTLWLHKLWALRVSPDSPKDSQPAWFLRLKAQIAFRGEVRLRISASAREPALSGLRRPVVLIPLALTRELSAAELESVALHELAHAKRRDNWTAAFAHAVTCLFWFYPLSWWLEKRLHEERELACDETVIRCGAAADEYFAGILKVCRFHLAREIAGVAGISGSNLAKRKETIMSILPEMPSNRAPKALIASLIAAVAIVPLTIGLLSTSNARAADAEFAGEALAEQRTAFTMARQANAPAQLVEATFGIKSLLLGAKLENVGKRPITQYRIGWIVVYRDGKTDMSSGPAMNVPAEIAPRAVAEVPDQGVSPKFVAKRPREIMFFVDEARFSSGELWIADTHSISAEATGDQSRAATTGLKSQNAVTCTSASVEYPEGTVIQVGKLPERMCVRMPDEHESHRTGMLVSRGVWVSTSDAIRQRSANIVHIPPPPPVYCSPGPPAGHGICTCQAEGEFSPGAQVNSAIGSFQLHCEKGNWVQTKQVNVKRF